MDKNGIMTNEQILKRFEFDITFDRFKKLKGTARDIIAFRFKNKIDDEETIVKKVNRLLHVLNELGYKVTYYDALYRDIQKNLNDFGGISVHPNKKEYWAFYHYFSDPYEVGDDENMIPDYIKDYISPTEIKTISHSAGGFYERNNK